MPFDVSPAPVTAVLGPTNTGKTHLAIERMLGHKTGMIGFPLRLLARENYDKIVRLKGVRAVALITGEEKILPSEARYFVCTVESMPLDRQVDFLAVDEIQLAGDPERGHVFTDRLMRARGLEETLFLGAETIRPLLARLIPKARFQTRRRLSRLEFIGPRKITRLPRRSAVVAFSVADVYVLAELVRRQRGGAAVVTGGLSPRTRNAQVAMYQDGEVDYLIATDAIGMGLNMDIDHVAFAAASKFDGRVPRKLYAPELAQIAGRAGRHMNDGTFGTTGDCPPLEDELVAAVETHQFEPIKTLYWRNEALSFDTIRDLMRTLEERPPYAFLIRTRDADDQQALEALSRLPDIADRATSRSRIRLLWDVCQIPDFQKTMTESHARLLAQVYTHLTDGSERLPSDWVAEQMSRFDRTDGDLDTLSSRVAHIRTWTYITHRGDWLVDAGEWQQRARAIEDRLSDALHDRLTQRFVDRRAATLIRKLKDEDAELMAAVTIDGSVLVEGHRVGHLDGFSFVPEAGDSTETKPLLAAARRVLPDEIARRVARLEADVDALFALDDRARVMWRGARVAHLVPGDSAWSPEIRVDANELITPPLRDRLHARLKTWFEAHLEDAVPKLVQLRRADLTGTARGILYQVLEGLGGAPSPSVDSLVKDLDDSGRKDLARIGVRLGTESLYIPQLLKPKAVRLRALLWSVANDQWPDEGPPPEGRVQVARAAETPAAYDVAIGYARLGGRAVRVDMVERLAAAVRQAARQGPFVISADMLSLAGVDHTTFAAMLDDLGYRKVGEVPAAPDTPTPNAPKSEVTGPGAPGQPAMPPVTETSEDSRDSLDSGDLSPTTETETVMPVSVAVSETPTPAVVSEVAGVDLQQTDAPETESSEVEPTETESTEAEAPPPRPMVPLFQRQQRARRTKGRQRAASGDAAATEPATDPIESNKPPRKTRRGRRGKPADARPANTTAAGAESKPDRGRPPHAKHGGGQHLPRPPREPQIDPNSPFAVLAQLKIKVSGGSSGGA
ncbi:MAG: disulfide oxidoreductase [Alphaproteobacteria bacterium]|nr:disulfide oxidoreductase [Alphaproteobacteria bacterium]